MQSTFFASFRSYIFSCFRAISYHITLFNSSISFISRLINIMLSQYCFKVPASVQNLGPGRLCCRVVQSSGGRLAVSVLISGIILTEKNRFDIKVWSEIQLHLLCAPLLRSSKQLLANNWTENREKKFNRGCGIIITFSGSLLRLIIRATLQTDDDLVRTRGQSKYLFLKNKTKYFRLRLSYKVS